MTVLILLYQYTNLMCIGSGCWTTVEHFGFFELIRAYKTVHNYCGDVCLVKISRVI